MGDTARQCDARATQSVHRRHDSDGLPLASLLRLTRTVVISRPSLLGLSRNGSGLWLACAAASISWGTGCSTPPRVQHSRFLTGFRSLSTPETQCGIAALWATLRYWGIGASAMDVRRAVGVLDGHDEDVCLTRLVPAARTLGLRPEVRQCELADIEDLLMAGVPPILIVRDSPADIVPEWVLNRTWAEVT